LADDPRAAELIQQAQHREPRYLTPAVRNVDTPAPAVVLRVQAPPAAPLNQDVDIRLTAENAGRVQARNVTVVYPLPPGIPPIKAVPNPAGQSQTELFWKLEKLDPGERKEIVLTVKPPPNATDLETKARVVVEQEQSARTKFVQAALKVTKTGPKQALRFDILVLGVTVTNASEIELRDVTVQDRLPPGLVHRPNEDKDRPYTQGPAGLTGQVSDNGQTRTWKIDRLGPRESRRIEYYVAAATAPAGPIEHTAFAQATGGAQDTAKDTVELIEPKLEVKAEAPPRKSATLPAAVRITLTNRGPRTLQNIVVTDSMDPCRRESVGGGQELKDGVQWIVPSLPPNQSRTLEVVLSKPDGGRVGHKVTAVYRGLTVPADAATEFEAVAALRFDFRGSTPTVEVNGEVEYEITLRNSGSAPATNIRPVIVLPEELAVVKAEPENRVEGGRVTFEPLAAFPPNNRAIFRVKAKAVKASLGARVTAEVGGDPFPTGPLTRQEMTAIGASPPAPPAAAPPAAVPLPVPVPPPPRP
jgi:uncharacterized repeat protein (TIGR01451 family)